MILKYNQYLSEKVVYDLLLESKVVYSKKFVNLLTKMKSNKLASELLDIYSTDVDGIVQNYIDITDEKDSVSFTPDRKVQELTKDKPQTWEVTESGKYLTNRSRNDKIFERLGYDKEKYGCWAPETGTIGTILGETISRQSSNIYIMFQEYSTSTPRIGVINKVAVQEAEDTEDFKIWSTSRNPIKIGRLVRAILTKAKVIFTDKDVEDIFAVYQSMGEAEKENISARLVSHNEIEENNWDLNIGRYLKADAAEVVDVQVALESFDQARTELAAAEKALLAKLKAAGYA